MKKFISILAILCLVFALTACSGGSSEPEGTEEDGQNPVMNFIGNYACDRANVLVECEGTDGMKTTVTWGSSAWENSEWVMSGTFDMETLTFEYHDCVRTDYVYEENGDVKSSEEVYTGGHGFMIFSENPLSLTWLDDKEIQAEGMTFDYVYPGEDGETTGMANPWSEADTAEAASEGAGIETFDMAEGMTISLGELNVEKYRYMDGLVEAGVPAAAVEMFIRKGKAEVAEDGDISGDYNEYANTWEQNIKGLTVKCFGNREGEATKTIWQSGDYCYAILAYGAGGDDDYGLSADDLNTIINGIQ